MGRKAATMSEYIVEMYDECEKYVLEYGCKPTYTQGFPLREEVVRCRDCANHTYTQKGSCRCDYWMTFVEPDGFCSRGEKASNFTTCKCGEDIELGNRESAVCPSCGRTVRA